MKVTKHGDKRVRQRIGIPRKAVEKLSVAARADGRKPADFTGSFRKYLDWTSREYMSTPLVYHGYIWAFAGDKLITVYSVPTRFRNHAKEKGVKDETI